MWINVTFRKHLLIGNNVFGLIVTQNKCLLLMEFNLCGLVLIGIIIFGLGSPEINIRGKVLWEINVCWDHQK